MNFVIQLIISTLAILIASYLLPGVEVQDFLTALIVAAVLAFLNAVIKPIMILFTIPITLISFGLFLVVINALIIMLADKLVDGFEVQNFGWALIFSIVLWLVTSILEGLKQKKDKDED